MAINLAEKYSSKVQERFSLGSKTDKYVGKDYDFVGVKTIKVYSVDTVDMVNYDRDGDATTGAMRFGKLNELGDSIQELTLHMDRAFTFSIDAGNASEQFNIKHANACLKRQIDEVVTPEVDAYRLNAWATGYTGEGKPAAPIIVKTANGKMSKDTIMQAIFEAGADMSEEKVPATGRTIFMPESIFVQFKLADVVMGGSDTLTTENVRRGYKGTIDGMDVVTAPSSYFPTGVNFIIKHKGATVDPFKLKNYRVHKNPMGVDGDVVEGRIIYDSFVLNSKAKGICVNKSA